MRGDGTVRCINGPLHDLPVYFAACVRCGQTRLGIVSALFLSCVNKYNDARGRDTRRIAGETRIRTWKLNGRDGRDELTLTSLSEDTSGITR